MLLAPFAKLSHVRFILFIVLSPFCMVFCNRSCHVFPGRRWSSLAWRMRRASTSFTGRWRSCGWADSISLLYQGGTLFWGGGAKLSHFNNIPLISGRVTINCILCKQKQYEVTSNREKQKHSKNNWFDRFFTEEHSFWNQVSLPFFFFFIKKKKSPRNRKKCVLCAKKKYKKGKKKYLAFFFCIKQREKKKSKKPKKSAKFAPNNWRSTAIDRYIYLKHNNATSIYAEPSYWGRCCVFFIVLLKK